MRKSDAPPLCHPILERSRDSTGRGDPRSSRPLHIAAEDAKDILQRMNKRILSTIKGS